MAEIKFQIKSILGGQSPLYHGAGEGQFLNSVAIDPEEYVSTNNERASGYIVPIGYAKFSGSVPSGIPLWIINEPKDYNTFVYASDGEFYRYGNTLVSETLIGTPTSGAGNGAVYINNYIALMTPTNVSVYGPLDGAPAISNTWWTGTAGLSALTDTNYPSPSAAKHANHAGHVHSDGKAYFCDFASGQGIIHKLGITSAGANDGSAYNVLDLPFGVLPFDIESYGTDLAIIGSVYGNSLDVRQGESYLFLWDTVSDSFYRQIPIPSIGFVSAIKNARGTLYIWGQSSTGGMQLYRYNGGYQMEQVYESKLGTTPVAGAVDSSGDRIIWGNRYVKSPDDFGALWAYGYENSKIGSEAVHCIGRVDSTDVSQAIGAVKFVEFGQGRQRAIIGWTANSGVAVYGLSKQDSTATKNSVFRSEVFTVGKKFKIKSIRIPVTTENGITIVPKIYFDDETQSKTLATINNSNYSLVKEVTYKALEIDQAATAGLVGKNSFYLEFSFTGTSANGIGLPVDIIVETRDS